MPMKHTTKKAQPQLQDPHPIALHPRDPVLRSVPDWFLDQSPIGNFYSDNPETDTAVHTTRLEQMHARLVSTVEEHKRDALILGTELLFGYVKVLGDMEEELRPKEELLTNLRQKLETSKARCANLQAMINEQQGPTQHTRRKRDDLVLGISSDGRAVRSKRTQLVARHICIACLRGEQVVFHATNDETTAAPPQQFLLICTRCHREIDEHRHPVGSTAFTLPK